MKEISIREGEVALILSFLICSLFICVSDCKYVYSGTVAGFAIFCVIIVHFTGDNK